MTTQETELIRKAQKGDRRAFESLLQLHYDTVFRMAYKLCGNRADAEDITQTVCIKLAQALGGFKFKAAFTSWLYRLTVNGVIDFYRSHNRETSLPDADIAQPGGSAEDAVYAREKLAAVWALPARERTALILVFHEGLTHAETARIMDCKESTVSWYIHEARKKLCADGESTPAAPANKKERSHG